MGGAANGPSVSDLLREDRAVPRFYFKIDGDPVVAEVDLETVAIAKREAIRLAGSIIRDEANKACLYRQWGLKLSDEKDRTFFYIGITATASPAIQESFRRSSWRWPISADQRQRTGDTLVEGVVPARDAEVAGLRGVAANYRRLADSMTDPASIASARQLANDYEAEADNVEEAARPVASTVGWVEHSATTMSGRPLQTACFLEKLFAHPPFTGAWTVSLVVAAIAVPTLIRALVDGAVSGHAFLPYVPFMMLSAVALRPAHAAAVAIGSALAADFFFMPPYFQLATGPSALFGIAAFLVCCGMAICVGDALRQLFKNSRRVQLA